MEVVTVIVFSVCGLMIVSAICTGVIATQLSRIADALEKMNEK